MLEKMNRRRFLPKDVAAKTDSTRPSARLLQRRGGVKIYLYLYFD